MHIVMQVLGRLMARFITVYTLMGTLLLQLVNNLHAKFTRIYQSVVTLYRNLLVQLKSNTKPYLAQFTNQGLLIKVGLINVLHKAGDLGQQLLQTAHKIRQRVLVLLKRDK
jgi:uncharacterized membrane protein